MSDIETSDWSEIAANNIQPAPAGWPANSSPMIVYSNGREDMGAIKRDWNRRNPTVTSGGSANVQTLTYSQGPVAYVTGQTFTFFVGFSNSGATTLNVNGLGAKNILLGGFPLTGGELTVGSAVQVVYDSAQFVIIGASAGTASVAGYLKLTGGTLTGPLTQNTQMFITGAAGTARALNFSSTPALNRWQILTNAVAEGGSNSGSDLAIWRCNDAGTGIDVPLSINRASGAVTMTGALTVPSLAVGINGQTPTTVLYLNGATGGNGRYIMGQTNGSSRWQMLFGNATAEGGSNSGSDCGLYAFNDAGTFLGNVYLITRATRVVTFAVAIVNGPSDRSLKENIQPLMGSLDKVQRLQGVSFDFIKDPTKRRQIGLVAQDVAPIVPEVMQDFIQPDEEPKLAIDYTRLTPLLVEAIKELTAKVTKLETELAAVAAALS